MIGNPALFDPDLLPTTTTLLEDTHPTLLAAKALGAVAGSLISIAYVLPKSRRDAFLRFNVGIVTGLIFGGTAGVKLADMLGLLGKVSAFEIALTGAAVSSLMAWWGLGVLKRLIDNWTDRPSAFSKLGLASNLNAEKKEQSS